MKLIPRDKSIDNRDVVSEEILQKIRDKTITNHPIYLIDIERVIISLEQLGYVEIEKS